MSKTIAVGMMLDELDVAEGMLRHLADEVDHLIIADNGSTDGTREILDQLAKELPLTVVDDPEVGYYQSEKLSALGERAAEMGADWVIAVDADEIWVAQDPHSRVKDALAGLDEAVRVVHAPLYNHLCTFIDNDDEPDPFLRMQWRQRQPGALPKVAVRWTPGSTIEQGNHGASLPVDNYVVLPGVLELRHFPVRSPGQLLSKVRNGAAAYKATNLPESFGAHWRSWGLILDRFGPEGIVNLFREHYLYLSPTDSGLIDDPAPYKRWQHKEEGAPE